MVNYELYSDAVLTIEVNNLISSSQSSNRSSLIINSPCFSSLSQYCVSLASLAPVNNTNIHYKKQVKFKNDLTGLARWTFLI